LNGFARRPRNLSNAVVAVGELDAAVVVALRERYPALSWKSILANAKY
jgi:hypothetical protein